MMEQLIEEIRMHFASHIQGIRQLNTLGAEFLAYSFRQGIEFGVAIPTESKNEVYEDAAQITIKTLTNMGVRYIVLTCCDETFRNDFAKFAAYFVTPGETGENRRNIIETPLNWWKGWIGMLGNRVGGRKTYDTIAEMLALEELYKSDPTICWTASTAGSHDLESETKSFEIKSTLKKSESTVTISSQYQLDSVKPLQLWFYRMEGSSQGVSINSMKARLVSSGYDENLIEAQLEARGFMPGNSSRDIKYVLLERRKFQIGESFPRIVESSFKNDKYPQNIIKILYSIDLEGLPYSS